MYCKNYQRKNLPLMDFQWSVWSSVRGKRLYVFFRCIFHDSFQFFFQPTYNSFKFCFFFESEIGCGPQDSIENKREKVKKKARFHLIAKDAFVALAVVVAKAPKIHDGDCSILVLLQTLWSNAEKYPDKLDKLFTLLNKKICVKMTKRTQ